MKRVILLTLLILPIFTYSQDVTFQSDSIYCFNKVKVRKEYIAVTENERMLESTNFYDAKGRLIKLQLEPFINGPQVSTFYFYGNNGNLENMIDSIKYGKPDKKKIKELKKLGILVDVEKNKNEFEVSNYKIEYENGQLVTLIKYNSDNTIDIHDRFENGGKKQIRSWYSGGVVYRTDTAESERPNHDLKYYGCEPQRAENPCWNYSFKNEYDTKGLLRKRQRFENGKLAEEMVFYYNDKNLLIQQLTKGVNQLEYSVYQIFEYSYY